MTAPAITGPQLRRMVAEWLAAGYAVYTLRKLNRKLDAARLAAARPHSPAH